MTPSTVMNLPTITLTTSVVRQIFTFHDHFFEISEVTGEDGRWWELEDELGSKVKLDSLDLSEVGNACRGILHEYNRALEEGKK